MRKRTQTFVTGTVLLALAMMVEGAIGAEPGQQPSPNDQWAIRLAGRIVRGTVKVQKTAPDADGNAQPHKYTLTVTDVIEGEATPGNTFTLKPPRPIEGAVIALFSSLGPSGTGPTCLAETPKNLDLVTQVICGCRADDVDGNIKNLISKREAARNMAAWNLFRITKPAHCKLKTVDRLSVPQKQRDSLLSKTLEEYGDDVTKAAFALVKADPQASKHVYIFKWYIYPKCRCDSILPPKKNYTGTWKAWYENGGRNFQMGFQNGKRHGKTMHWFEDGGLECIAFYEQGAGGQAAYWSKNGDPVEIVCGHRDGHRHGLRIMIDRKRETFDRMWIFEGKVVTEQEFRRLSK